MPTEEVETTLQKKEQVANMDEENTRLNVARRKRGFFADSSGDTAYLKVIPEARAKRQKSVVLSMPCLPKEGCSGRTAALPTFCCSGKRGAAVISNSKGQEGPPHQNPEKDLCLNSTTTWYINPFPSRKR